jgi:hypothetical protein
MGFECLTDYIGIKWQNAKTPASGLYINQLPGVSLKSIDNLANAEQKDFLGVWSDVQVRSLTRLQTEVTNYFAKRYQLVTILEQSELPTFYQIDINQTAPAPNWRGFTFDLGWYGSALASIHIESLNIYLQEAQSNLEIQVWNIQDATSLVLVDTLIIPNAVPGWNFLEVDKDYPFYKIMCGYDGTSQTSVYMPFTGTYNQTNGWYGITMPWGPPQSMYQGWLRGGLWDGTNLVEGMNFYGMSGQISTGCAFDSILCNKRAAFKLVLWYLLGIELMNERIFSERLNRFTTIDMKKAEKMQEYFQEQFDKNMAACFDGIELTTWDGCIKCQAPVRLEHMLP